jgi:hypothetical protein
MKSRLLTIEEANRMLPLLRKIVHDIRGCWEFIIARRTELECLEKNSRQATSAGDAAASEPPRVLELKDELNRLIERINSYIREVEDLGCYVEEFKRGIINFPSLYHGRKIFLCWGMGDDQVDHWHELDESYNDRLRIHEPEHFLSEKQKAARGT